MVQEAQDGAVMPTWVEDHKDSRPTGERSTRLQFHVLTANTLICFASKHKTSKSLFPLKINHELNFHTFIIRTNYKM